LASTDTRIREKIGGVAIHKGKKAGTETPIVMWDAIPKCDPDTCPIEDVCPYMKNGKCTLRANYQKHVVDCVLSCFEEVDKEQMLKIGMHLIPLYAQLIQMKIHALKAAPLVISRGALVPNPIFKEVRTIIRDITFVLRDLGISREDALKGGDLPSMDNSKGSSTYYDTLLEG
jgi:hypothetical protein